MMNNYNPYSVPENYFETAINQALSNYHARKRAVLCCAAAIIAAVILVAPIFVHFTDAEINNTEVVANNLASMYEYDIFLQVNF